ncbi:hypothetical protein [Sphingomonas koreensis]|uniref:hypothetical protein n=1 Tax=Sphingomonas koreensis TaxID=93064 RepID=UPI003BAF6B19
MRQRIETVLDWAYATETPRRQCARSPRGCRGSPRRTVTSRPCRTRRLRLSLPSCASESLSVAWRGGSRF